MNKKILESLVEQGKSLREIADAFDKSVTTIRYWIKKYSIARANYKIKDIEVNPCLCCGKDVVKKNSTLGFYCNNSCQQRHAHCKRVKNWIETGCYHTNTTLRGFLEEIDGSKCSVCGISEWNDKPIILEVEHKDGNSEDCAYENVCLICPNCHSQTETYKGKNVGKGRHSRRKRYQEGKSY